MKTVYFVRHGEATANIRSSDLYEGYTSPLTEVGWKQAEKIAERASKLPVDILLASTMLRAQQTAGVISKKIGKEIESSDLFTERRDPESFIGRIWADPETQRGYEEWKETSFMEGKRVLDGETFGDMKDRARKALSCLESLPKSHILVVTHGFFLRMLLAYLIFGDSLRPDEFRKFIKATRTDNTGITVLTFGAVPQHAVDLHEERWMIRVYNDHAHLG
jgi:broad specificity phosphatase PhoE